MNTGGIPLSENRDEIYMQQALALAGEASAVGEVPVGCVVVYQNQIIANSRNEKETRQDPTAHAELIAISAAAKHLSTWRLKGCTLYSTLEPCPMCAGAIVQSRIDRVVIGTMDPKTGAMGSLYSLHNDPRLNHSVDVTKGVCEDACAQLLKSFFKDRRKS